MEKNKTDAIRLLLDDIDELTDMCNRASDKIIWQEKEIANVSAQMKSGNKLEKKNSLEIKKLQATVNSREADANSYRSLYNDLNSRFKILTEHNIKIGLILAESDTLLDNAGYEPDSPCIQNDIIALIGDRDMYSKDAEEWKAKASKLNAEKRKFMDIVNNQATNSQDMFCEYKDWLATRNGKGEK